MPLEQLSPDTLTGRLINRCEELTQLLTTKLKAIKSAPEGHLRIAQAHKGQKLQYFQITKRGDTKGTYIPHAKQAMARRLAQKDYDTRLIKELSQEIRILQKYLSLTKSGSALTDLYTKLSPARRERVRSKSEVIIANTLARFNIPYRYEYPLELKNGHTVHPDFLCLNARTRAEFYWEHFGLMDEPDYLERTLAKIKDYAESGIEGQRGYLFP